MARILLLLLVWILRHTLGDIEQRFEQSDFRGRGGLIYTQAEVGYTTRNPLARVYDIEMVDTICTGTCFVYNAGFVVVYLIEFIFFTIV